MATWIHFWLCQDTQFQFRPLKTVQTQAQAGEV